MGEVDACGSIHGLRVETHAKPREIQPEGAYAHLHHGECCDGTASLTVYHLHQLAGKVL